MSDWVMSRTAPNREVSYPRDRALIRVAGYALLIGAGYYVGARLGFALTLQTDAVSTLWPPNAILLAAFLLAPTRKWWVVVLAAFPVHVIVELESGVPKVLILCWFISNICEALIGAACLRYFGDGEIRFDRFWRVGMFIGFAVFLAPFASSFLDAGFVTMIGWRAESYWTVWYT